MVSFIVCRHVVTYEISIWSPDLQGLNLLLQGGSRRFEIQLWLIGQVISSPRLLWFHDFGASERYIWCWRLTKCWANKGSMCDQLLGKGDQDHHGTLKNASTWSTCLARCPNFAQLYMTLTYFDSPVSTCAQVSMPCLELFKMQPQAKLDKLWPVIATASRLAYFAGPGAGLHRRSPS